MDPPSVYDPLSLTLNSPLNPRKHFKTIKRREKPKMRVLDKGPPLRDKAREEQKNRRGEARFRFWVWFCCYELREIDT